LGFSHNWVLDQWEAGKLPGFRIGDRKGAPVRFRLSEIEEFLDTKREGPRMSPGDRPLRPVR
ncbi:MAG: hypothetical protein ACE5EV_02885, partial [Gaiellales bacterium]